MKQLTATAGNNDAKKRSDCFVSLEIKDKGGIEILLKSKVEVMFAESIKEEAKTILNFFNIENAILSIEDKGALPFVLAARIEAAVKKIIETDKKYLPDFIEENKYQSEKDTFRFSRLYIPGNTPNMMLNAGLHKPNGIILDLEDSVAYTKKDEARLLVRNALRSVNFYGAERMVRINQFPLGLKDLQYIVPQNIHIILLPKCEDAQQVLDVEKEIERIKSTHNISAPIYLMPIIESCLGVEKAFEIATASKNIIGLAIGLEDYTADLGAQRTKEGHESFYARTRIVNACKATGIQAIDSVFSDVDDPEGLKRTVEESKSLGFDGIGCIHPRQMKTVHEAFAPTEAEIKKAQKIILAFDDATTKGLGVISLGSKMIDPPVVQRAEKTIKLALFWGLIPENWKEKTGIRIQETGKK